MVNWLKVLGVAVLPAVVLLSGSASVPAATSATSDILSDRPGEAPETVDIGSVKPLVRPNREAARPVLNGNPLWSVPLSVLTATRERPIFLASRRPPQIAVVAPPQDEVSVPVQTAAEPDRSPLALIGAVVGDSDAIALFIDRSNQKIVRLRQGDAHAGWVLSTVQGREVTLKKADRTETLALRANDAPAGPPVLPTATAIGAGPTDGSYAPFIPRSTPKNGESDGL
jgi:general secretion pathway protein N